MKMHPAWRSPLHTIRERLSFSVNPEPVRRAAFAVLDAVQFFQPHYQLDALFNLGVAMAQTLGLDPHELVARAKRMLPDVEGPYTDALQTARDYAKGELAR